MASVSRQALVSACLLGRRCRYDGDHRHRPGLLEALRAAGLEPVPVCPEEAGGLGTPRPPAELHGGDGHAVLAGRATVRTRGGRDLTRAFLAGARAALERAPGAAAAILKARSPSCGVGRTRVDGRSVAGDGVFAALLRERGIPLRTDEEALGNHPLLTGT